MSRRRDSNSNDFSTDSDDQVFGFDDDAPLPPHAWSHEGRTDALAPLLSLFEPMDADEQRQWCLPSIVPPQHFWAPEQFSVAKARNAIRSFARHLEDPATANIPTAFIFDIVFRRRLGDAVGPAGIQGHFHGVMHIPTSDRTRIAAVRKSFQQYAPGEHAVQFQSVRMDKGGIAGRLRYALKDWRDPQKTAPVPGGTQPCNDWRTTFMRNRVEEAGLLPQHLIVLRRLRRFGGVVRPAPTRTRTR